MLSVHESAPTGKSVQSEIADWVRTSPRPTDDDPKRLAAIKRNISQIESLVCNAMAYFGLPLNLRAYIPVLLAASGGETEFDCSYAEQVPLLFKENDPRSTEAKKAEVARLVKALEKWQEKSHVRLVHITTGRIEYDKNGKEINCPTRFELVLLDGLAQAIYDGTPRPDQMRARVRSTLNQMFKRVEPKTAKKPVQPDVMQERNRNLILTKVQRVIKAEIEAGGDPEAYFAALVADMRAKFEATVRPDSLSAGDPENVNVDDEGDYQGGGVTDSSHPLARNAVAAEAVTNAGGGDEIVTSNTEEIDAISSTPLAPPVSLIAPVQGTQGGDMVRVTALRTVEAFASVGAGVWEVTLKDDATGARTLYEAVDNLAAHLDRYLRRNAEAPESFIVRPRGGAYIQIDDVDPTTLDRLTPFAFLTVETSANNFQAWLCLPVGTSEVDRLAVNRRVLRALKGTGANGGAYGAVRWPGSINQKPERNGFRVRLVAAQLGRTVTPEELEAAGLLPPLPSPPRVSHEAPKREAAASRLVRLPDYQKCLLAHPKKDSKRGDGYDHSEADAAYLAIAKARGITRADAVAELERVSVRAREERARGRKDYLSRTAKFVGI